MMVDGSNVLFVLKLELRKIEVNRNTGLSLNKLCFCCFSGKPADIDPYYKPTQVDW